MGNRDLDFGGRSIELRSANGPDNCVIDLQGATRAFHFHSGESAAAVIDGFTVQNGDVTAGTPPRGGAVYCENGSAATFANCVFRNNHAYDGGAAHCRDGSHASFEQCAFISNAAVLGGALSGTTFSDLTVTNCHFEGNAATQGGAIRCDFADAAIHNSRFYDNTAIDISGADAAGGAIMLLKSYGPISHCHFAGHLTEGPGTIGLYKSNPAISNCVLEQNQALWGAGIYANMFSIPKTQNCTFVDNWAFHQGGGMYVTHGSAYVQNCLFWGNSTAGGNDPQIYNGNNTPITFSDVQGGFPGFGNIDTDPLFVDADNGDYRLTADSPCIDAGINFAVPQDITTDLDGNPRFLEIPETPDTGYGTPPVVDMGAYESLGGGCLAVISQDIACHADGTTFTVNTEGLNACTGGTTQVTFTASGGAVGEELCFTALVNDGGFCCSTEICVTIPDCTPAANPSDLDGDGIVGMVDFLVLLGAWGSCSDCGTPQACPADFDGDCSVGIGDMMILLGTWS